MIKLWQLLIYGHVHKWKLFETCKQFDSDAYIKTGKIINTGQIYYHRCDICGKVKNQVV